MENNFCFKGFWWLPDHPNEKFSGELKVESTGKLILSVLESSNFPSALREIVDKLNMIPLIHGYARNQYDGKDVSFSVFNGVSISRKISGLSEYSFVVEYVTTYKHFENPDELTFASIFLEIQLLNEWANISGLQAVKDKPGRRMNFSFSYKQPRPITLFKNKDMHAYLWVFAVRNKLENGIELHETIRLNIQFGKPLDYNGVLEKIEYFQNFLSFCISLPISIKRVMFHQYSKSQMKKRKQDYQTTYDLIISDGRVFTKQARVKDSNMLLPLSKISHNLEGIFMKWVELADKYQPALKLYFDTLYNPSLYKENTFLNNVAALEVYHRLRNPSFDGKQSESYQKMLTSIISQLPNSNQRNWLMSRLERKREVHLLGRIMDIAERTPVFSERVLKDVREFSEIVSNTRHFLTHFDQGNKEKGVAEGAQLVELIGKTRLLLQMQFLLDLGLTESEADSYIKQAISNWYVWNR